MCIVFSFATYTIYLRNSRVSLRKVQIDQLTHQFVKLHLQVLLLYIDISVSTEGLVYVLGTL